MRSYEVEFLFGALNRALLADFSSSAKSTKAENFEHYVPVPKLKLVFFSRITGARLDKYVLYMLFCNPV